MNLKLDPYQKRNKKTVRTNIDGHFTCKIDNCLQLEKGMVIEIAGEPEIYKVQRVISEIPKNPSFQYYLDRQYDEIMESSLMKSVNLTELTKDARKKHCEFIGEEFDENKYKENYEIFGIGLQFDGRLSKNQTVRMNDNVITITELVKPEEKGGRTEIKGIEVDRVILESVHRVYVKDEIGIDFLAEYETWGHALMLSSRFNERMPGRSFL